MIIKELTYNSDSPIYFEKIKHLEWPVFLDSCYQKEKPKSEYARFDIIAAEPFIKIRTKNGLTIVSDEDGDHQYDQNSLEILSDLMDKYNPQIEKNIPFVGGAIGYCSYELNLKTIKKNNIDTMTIGIYDWAVIVDHFEKKTYIVSMLFDSKTEFFLNELVSIFNKNEDNLESKFKIKNSVSDNLSFIDYKSKFDKVMKSKKRTLCAPPAPALGLYLKKIIY